MATLSREEAQDLASPPFVVVDGVVNIRDLGGYDSMHSNGAVKPKAILRSGEMTHITDAGKQQLKELGVRKVFDLRADVEIKRYNALTQVINGVEIIRVPITAKEWADPTLLAARLKAFGEKERETFVVTYTEFLEDGRSAYETIFTYLRDEPNPHCLVHCTAGKDRTGVFACLLLMLLGVDDEVIANDYALTTIGLEPGIEILVERFSAIPVFKENWDGVLNMGSSRAENMIAFMKAFREKYGSVEGYLKVETKLKTEEDIAKIRRNLLVERAS